MSGLRADRGYPLPLTRSHKSAYHTEPAGHQNHDHCECVVLLFLRILLARSDPVPDRVATARSNAGIRTGMTPLCFFIFRSGHRFPIDEMAAVILTLCETHLFHFTMLSQVTAFRRGWCRVVSESCVDDK